MADQEENANSDTVVTMVDVLKEQEDFEENANAVLGASDDKNCTYQKGYVKRQALYACLTCCSDSKIDATKRAGLCLACSLTCHENHELIELYTKRNFRCDCGGPKFNSHPCQFTPLKRDLNNENKYNQNFSGVYCICHRPYPDPEACAEEEMIQCIICEDWLHTGHLEAKVPANDQYSEMICKQCMDSHCFLDDYIEHSVNAGTEFLNNSDLDILNSSAVNTDKIDDSNKSKINISISENEEMELAGGNKSMDGDLNGQQLVMQNINEQEEVDKKSKVQENDDIQVDREGNNTSSEQLINTDQVQTDDEKRDSKEDNSDNNREDKHDDNKERKHGDKENDNLDNNEKDNLNDNEKENPSDNEKDNPGDNEKDVPDNDDKDNPDDVNSNMETESQIKELKEVDLRDVVPITETISEERNKDFKELPQTDDIISSIDPDNPNSKTYNDSEKMEFREACQVDDTISNDKEENVDLNIEIVSQNKEAEDSNITDVVPNETEGIQSQATVENKSSIDLENSTSSESILKKIDSPSVMQKQENCPDNEIPDKSPEVDTIDIKYDTALSSEKTVDVKTAELSTSDVKSDIFFSQNDKLDNITSTISIEKRDTDSITSEKTHNISDKTLSQYEDNGKELNETLCTENKDKDENFIFPEPVTVVPEYKEAGEPVTVVPEYKKDEEPVTVIPECNEDTKGNNSDNNTETEKAETKSECKDNIEENVNSEFVDTINSNDLKISNEKKSDIDNLQTLVDDTNQCDNVKGDSVVPVEKDDQEHMDIDEKEEKPNPIQEEDERLLLVNEISPKTIQDNSSEEELKEKANADIDINNILEKQVDIEVSTSSKCNPNNVIMMSVDTENLVDNDQIESQMKDEDVIVAESLNMQKCTKMGDDHIAEDEKREERGNTTIVDNNDTEMNDTVMETSDTKVDTETLNNNEKMNEGLSETAETKTDNASENDGLNKNDLPKAEIFGESNEKNEVNGKTLNENKVSSEDVEMGDIKSAMLITESDREIGLELCNTEKSDDKHIECNIKESTLEASPPCDSQNIKRKQDSDNFIERKKIKIEDDVDVTGTEAVQCFRPHKPKHGHKGATFWPCNWRKKLCSCFNCVAMYRNNDVLFLIDVEDTVSAYEDLGKSNANSQYAKGLEALSSLDRIQQINAITEYNKMKEKLLDFLKSFKDKREVVKEEDIKEFFAGMKPRREPDGVYFCR